VLTAAWFLVLVEHFHMSGEWVVGGVEGKAFAYAFVWLGMAALVQNQWRRAWIWLGLATAFHALVGGWATVAALITCLTFGESRRQVRQMIPAMLVGLLLAAPSLVAGLSLDHGVDPELNGRAARIMVHSRLSHHLAIHTFSHWFIIRFVALALVWLLLSGYAARQHPPEQRLNRIVAVALAIALLGAIIDQGLLWNLELAARLLKFYWYRLADALLPAGVALTLASAVVRKRQHNRESAGWLLVLLIVIPAFVLGPSIHGRRYDFRPQADRRWDAAITDPARRIERYDNWRKVCRWIKDNTPDDALLATPRAQQTFKWYAQRAEVVNWKDIPQDAAHIVEWLNRQRDWFPRRVLYWGVTALSDERILELAKQYDVQYLVVERGRMRRPLGPAFLQVYPSGIEENSDFAVMKILDADLDSIDELQAQ
jgi:hypothetical protein